jgi:GNAT superfamily N-acetyltransferase
MAITTTLLQGREILTHLNALAELRCEVFRSYPYLYEGSLEYERSYLAHYAEVPGAVLVLARDDNIVIGASTAMPLAQETKPFRSPFETLGWNVNDYFYLAESVLRPSWRGRGLGHIFFELRERAAEAQGFSKCAFCAVVRATGDERRPSDHRELSHFWRKRGYVPAPELVTALTWPEVGRGEVEHLLQYWTRELALGPSSITP